MVASCRYFSAFLSTFQDTTASECRYWLPADTEAGIHKQLSEKTFPKIVDKLVSLESKLGEGEFGEVYKGLWKVPGKSTPTEVAVKIPKGNSDGNRIRVLQEVAILGQFNHPRVAKLCGMVTLGNPVRTALNIHAFSCYKCVGNLVTAQKGYTQKLIKW